MSDEIKMSAAERRAQLLRDLNDAADSIHDKMIEFRGRVRSLMQHDITDSDAAGFANEVSDLRDVFADAYDVMERCENALGADDPAYRDARARLLEDYRQLNIIEHDFEQNRERPAEERERIPELEPDDEEIPEEELTEEPEPEEEVIVEVTDPDEERKQKAAEYKERQKHFAEQGRKTQASDAAAVAAAREAERLRRDTLAAEEQRRQQSIRDEAARRAEQDARLAREAEDRAHREAVTRGTDEPARQASTYEYETPTYGRKEPEPATPEYHPQTLHELHEQLVEEHRVVDADYTPDKAPQYDKPAYEERPQDTGSKPHEENITREKAPRYVPPEYVREPAPRYEPAGYESPRRDHGFEPVKPDSSTQSRAEQDARLAREAEERAHREAMSRGQAAPETPVSGPSVGYEMPEYTPQSPQPAPQQDTHRPTLHEEHERLAEEHRVVDADYRPSDAGYAPTGDSKPDADFKMPPPPYRAPQSPDSTYVKPDSGLVPPSAVEQAERSPVSAVPPFVAATMPAFDAQAMMAAQSRLQDSMASMSAPVDATYAATRAAERPDGFTPAYEPTDPDTHRSGGAVMQDARRAVAGMNIPDIGAVPVASSAGNMCGTYGARRETDPPSFVPKAPEHKAGEYAPDIGAYVPTAIPATDAGAHAVQAAFGNQVTQKSGDTVTTAPISHLAASAAAAGFQFNKVTPDGTPTSASGATRMQVYGIVAPDGKSVFIDTVQAGGLNAAYQFHTQGGSPTTAPMFAQAKADGKAPTFRLLAECDVNTATAAMPLHAFAKRFQDDGVDVFVAGGKVNPVKLEEMPAGSRGVYNSLSSNSMQDILGGNSFFRIKQTSGAADGLAGAAGAAGVGIIAQKVANQNAGIFTRSATHAGTGQGGAGVTGAVTEATKRAKGVVTTDSRADGVKHALSKFCDKSNPGFNIANAARVALVSTLTQGDDLENPFVNINKGYIHAREAVIVSRAVLLPATNAASGVAAMGHAAVEKAVYGKYASMGDGAFKSALNKQTAFVDKLTAQLADAPQEAAAAIQSQLNEAKRELSRMNKYSDIKLRNEANIDAANLVKSKKVAVVNGTVGVQQAVAEKGRSVANMVRTSDEFANLRAQYKLDDLVKGKDLSFEMFNIRGNGRDVREAIKEQKAVVKSLVGDKAAVNALRKKDALLKKVASGKASAEEVAKAKGILLTADERKQLKELKKLDELLKKKVANAGNFNDHRKYMELMKSNRAVAEQTGKRLDKILQGRHIVRAGIKTVSGLAGGFMLTALMTSNDYTLQGAALSVSGAKAGLSAVRVVGRRTGISAWARNKMGIFVQKVMYPVRYATDLVTAPVKQAASKVVSAAGKGALSAASSGASFVAGKVNETIAKNATASSVKASAKAGVGVAKKGLASVKKLADKAAGSAIGKAASAVGKGVAKVASGVAKAVSAVAGFLGAAVGFLMMVIMWFLIIIIVLLCVISIFDSGKTADDGRIDLSDYDTYINDSWAEYQRKLQREVDPGDYGCESVEWFIPDMPYNKLVVLSMMKVRLEHQTDLVNAEDEDTADDVPQKSPSKRSIKSYTAYMTEALNPIETYIDERQREVEYTDTWTDEDGNEHSDTYTVIETYYVLQVSINPYTFSGTEETFALTNADGTVSLGSVDNYGPIKKAEFEGWTQDNVTVCELVYRMDWDDLYTGITGVTFSSGDLEHISESAQEIIDNLPDDLSPERRAIVEYALSLERKVPYFWGGKSLTLGWDSRWNTIKQVTAPGSSSSGTYCPYGLDCSGFVDWVFYNATGGAYYPGQGGGSNAQRANCYKVSWSTCKPGDLCFYENDSGGTEHVGIVAGWDAAGNVIIVHCASGNYGSAGSHTVVVTGKVGFDTVYRPNYYASWES